MHKRQPYWEMRELVVIGVFAAVTKVSSILVALVGGGMNPLTLILKSLLFTTLTMVLLYKVRKAGALILFLLVNAMVSMLLMGGWLFLVPPMILAGLAAEGVMLALGGYSRSVNLVIGVGLYDLLFKAGSVGVSYLYMREQQEMVILSAIIVGIGYIGALLGLFTGTLFVKELRHACIIRS